MSITSEFEVLIADNELMTKLATIQNLQQFQELYKQMLGNGLVQKRQYNLAPVNVLGTQIPGQTTYRVVLGS
jgi:hypothetical protein